MKRKIVEVEWFDAQSSMDAWTIQDLEVLKPIITHTIGYLTLDKKDYVVISFCEFGHGLIKHHQCIPRGMIKKITVIRKGFSVHCKVCGGSLNEKGECLMDA